MARLAARGAAGLVLAVVVLAAVLLQGQRAWARDHSFLVIAPPGWTQSFAAVATDDSTPLLRLSAQASDGSRGYVVVDHAPAVLPDRLDQLVTNAGPVQCESPATSTSVGTADALLTDCRTAEARVEVIYITRGDRHYVAVLSAADTQFDHLRSDFRSMLDSWAWQR